MSTNSKSAGPRPDDHVIVLFGATGDLARRKEPEVGECNGQHPQTAKFAGGRSASQGVNAGVFGAARDDQCIA
jgi:hypothetical protein